MNTKRIRLHIGLTLMFLGTVCVTGSAWTRTVGKDKTSCPDAQYDTITAAVNAAAPGDVIEICPALYPEQLIIAKPLTLRGVSVDVNGDDVKRVLIQPPSLVVDGLGFETVITVMNTHGVTIENLAVDASKNSVSGCTPGLATIHYYNASGTVKDNAIFGAQLTKPGCPGNLPFGNGFGVLVDSNLPGPFHVSVKENSIHDFTANGVLVEDKGVTAQIEGNGISGVGPSGGVFQFGVFIANGAVGLIKHNLITEGACGGLAFLDCLKVRSEGVTLRAVGDGTVVDHNIITRAQSGIFINGANDARITNNLIGNIDVLDGIDIQGTASGFFTNSRIDGNTIFNVAPIDNQSCGVSEFSGTGVSGNTITHTTVNDAYCGVAFVTADRVESGDYHNTLFTEVNADTFTFPPAVEP